MDICRRVDIEVAATFRAGLPPGWAEDPVLGRYRDHLELIEALRSQGPTSDEVVRSLLAQRDQRASLLLVSASIPLVVAWSRKDWLFVADSLAEVAMVIEEVRSRPAPPGGRCLLHVMVDLACDRLRKRRLRARPPVPISSDHPAWNRSSGEIGPDELAIGHLSLAEVRRDLVRDPERVELAVRSWNTVVSVLDCEVRTQADRNRLNHARRQLRLIVDPLLVA